MDSLTAAEEREFRRRVVYLATQLRDNGTPRYKANKLVWIGLKESFPLYYEYYAALKAQMAQFAGGTSGMPKQWYHKLNTSGKVGHELSIAVGKMVKDVYRKKAKPHRPEKVETLPELEHDKGEPPQIDGNPELRKVYREVANRFMWVPNAEIVAKLLQIPLSEVLNWQAEMTAEGFRFTSNDHGFTIAEPKVDPTLELILRTQAAVKALAEELDRVMKEKGYDNISMEG